MKSIVLVIALVLSGMLLIAQEAILTTGGDASGSGGSASYSVGQVMYNTHFGTNGSVAQGVQQPYEISIITGLEETDDINLTYTVFPNPTNDILKLEVEKYDNHNLSYQLYTMNGELMVSKKLTGNITSISMADFVRATYFLTITDKQKRIKTFKIIKN